MLNSNGSLRCHEYWCVVVLSFMPGTRGLLALSTNCRPRCLLHFCCLRFLVWSLRVRELPQGVGEVDEFDGAGLIPGDRGCGYRLLRRIRTQLRGPRRVAGHLAARNLRVGVTVLMLLLVVLLVAPAVGMSMASFRRKDMEMAHLHSSACPWTMRRGGGLIARKAQPVVHILSSGQMTTSSSSPFIAWVGVSGTSLPSDSSSSLWVLTWESPISIMVWFLAATAIAAGISCVGDDMKCETEGAEGLEPFWGEGGLLVYLYQSTGRYRSELGF
ncbi:hypothetical protein F5883DRAFT_575129 [Diaporthe sp. PMI_573]|nr:hypothetical protein F5883DRAFT_575129 [Diaporthaceae sp. PMI_573]